jgi:hypothetical protein
MIESNEALVSVRGLDKKFGGFSALTWFELDIQPGGSVVVGD